MRVSIVLPCRNEARHIGTCLTSLIATTYPVAELELLVVDGMSDDATREIVAQYAALHPWIRIVENPRRTTPAAMNAGIRAATGDLIVRVDAHAIYPKEYVETLVTALIKSGADNVGGPLVTLPGKKTPEGEAVAIAMSHPFGVGNSYFRIGSAEPRWVDTVAYGCYRRDVFRRIGMFDEELIRNQDDELNHRLIRSGGRILLVPGAVSYYYARDTIRQIGLMQYQYGLFKPIAGKKVGRISTLRQLVPPAFLAGVVGGGLLGFVWPALWLVWAAGLAVYAAVALICAVSAARQRGIRCTLLLAAAFPVLHACYGWGYLRGLWAVFGPRRGDRSWSDPTTVPLTR